MTLDDVRNLEPDEVTAIDIQVLKENKDQLTEDESLRFASFLEEKIETPEPIIDPPAAVVPEPTPAPTPVPVPEKITFTKEEIAELVADEIKKLSSTPAVPVVPTAEEITPFVPNDWEPSGWGEVFDKAVEFAAIKNAKMTAAAQKELDTINDTLTSQIDALREAGEPIPAKGTKEYKEFDDSLTKVALEYQIPTFTSAYKVWQKINAAPVTPIVTPKPAVNKENKELAEKISGARVENGSSAEAVKYKDIRGKSPRQVADAFLAEMEDGK